jgi:folate-binding Fe-S cluster repair protein YgfZ
MEHRGIARTRAIPVRFSNGFGVVGGAEVKIAERVVGRVGECFDDFAIAIIRLDHLKSAIITKDTISAGGVPLVCNTAHIQEFHRVEA